ncbi:hypothetical protein BMETH_711_1 [methanotrophic bacterial endosymbiont of Bathymodiolus sp.]|nr:hypothetical protein BMETH_711_1 [methanotrophic bacterial endosymbiont of Bathymodiolus sp.]
MSLPLPHRHSIYNPDKLDLIGAYDDKDRATTIIYLLQNEFVACDRSLDDIQSLLNHYINSMMHQTQKKP